MDSKNIQHILKQKEGLSVEFKKATDVLPSNLFESVCAFLNRQGGTILLGVDDGGEVIGIDETKVENCAEILLI